LAGQARAATFTVTTTANEGPGSIRDAFNKVNSNLVDFIFFSIPPFDGTAKVILITNALPAITNRVSIDGYSQDDASLNTSTNGNNAVLRIELRSTNHLPGLVIAGGNSSVSGLALDGFDTAIRLSERGGNYIEGNFIGTDPSGLTKGVYTNRIGLLVASAGNSIGGLLPSFRNVISGNSFEAVLVEGARASNNLIRGNYIGTDRHGASAIPNNFGIVLSASSSGTLIGGEESGEGNVISGNVGHGILDASLGKNQIRGNLIGTDVIGKLALGNGGHGISIGSPENEIGTGEFSSLRAGGNVISANRLGGIRFNSVTASNNTVRGNFIGTDVEANKPLGNLGNGITISQGHDNFIGARTFFDGNVISANQGSGISIGQPALVADTVILNNRIGTGIPFFFEEVPLGNAAYGIVVLSARDSTIAANSIGFNAFGGIAVRGGGSSTNNRLAGYEGFFEDVPGNFISQNGGLGIDLAFLQTFDGVSTNDHCDADTGSPNRTQNFPVLTAVTNTGEDLRVEGFLIGESNQTYRLEFFANRQCDPSGHGEGQKCLGYTMVTNGLNCGVPVNFSVTLRISFGFDPVTPCTFITATATDPDGNTSEFSQCFAAGESGFCLDSPPGFVGWWAGDGSTTNLAPMGASVGLSNGTTYATGKVDRAFLFDGVNDFASVPNSVALQPLSFTLEAWVEFNSVPGAGRRQLMGKPVGAGFNNSYTMFLQNGVLGGALGNVSSVSTLLTTFAPVTGVWYHVAYTFDRDTTNHAIHVNGVLQRRATPTAAVGYDNRDLMLGADRNAGTPGEFFAGLLDEPTVYDRALATEELQEIFCAGSAGKCKGPCAIDCPSDLTVGNDFRQCGAVVAYPLPTTMGLDCPEVVCTPAPGSFFLVGTSTVTCTTNGQTACTFAVIVEDTELPFLMCPPNIRTTTASNVCATITTFATPAIFDNCGGAVVCSPPSGSAFPGRVTTVTCTATDHSGNQAACSFTVTVLDVEPPRITCSSNIVVTASPGQSRAVLNFAAPVVSDNCGILSVNCIPPSGSAFPVGTNMVTCTATDTSTNRSSCQFLIVVKTSTEFGLTGVRIEGNDVRVSWQADGGTTNRVQSAPSVASPFSDLSPNIVLPGAGLVNTNFLDRGGAISGPSRYYRIHRVP
jgi:hypothetical protein